MVDFRNKTFKTSGPELRIAMDMIVKAKLGYTCFIGHEENMYCLTHTRSTSEEFRMRLIGTFLKVTVEEVKDLEDKAWSTSRGSR